MKIQKQTEKKRLVWWQILLILLFLFWAFSFFSNEDYNDEYKECVEDCINEVGWCISDYTQYTNNLMGYILDYDAEECVYDLESCIGWCEK